MNYEKIRPRWTAWRIERGHQSIRKISVRAIVWDLLAGGHDTLLSMF